MSCGEREPGCHRHSDLAASTSVTWTTYDMTHGMAGDVSYRITVSELRTWNKCSDLSSRATNGSLKNATSFASQRMTRPLWPMTLRNVSYTKKRSTCREACARGPAKKSDIKDFCQQLQEPKGRSSAILYLPGTF